MAQISRHWAVYNNDPYVLQSWFRIHGRCNNLGRPHRFDHSQNIHRLRRIKRIRRLLKRLGFLDECPIKIQAE